MFLNKQLMDVTKVNNVLQLPIQILEVISVHQKLVPDSYLKDQFLNILLVIIYMQESNSQITPIQTTYKSKLLNSLMTEVSTVITKTPNGGKSINKKDQLMLKYYCGNLKQIAKLKLPQKHILNRFNIQNFIQ
ncbi:hypothetical protein IMG5_102180 [Ichthyophthirius multifiliis]|uniref:Uncharacterized protein n=1 Tax=Ichthyophthirius multifiliis TaxID=5932 RepID=G0QSM0_ICHMU|nr:hypothetical protein IMG5_102180 [Ichthyophthirius multifiliis]EGR31779.1 hypothetical protein IMG5_102180 [Ichthyophthirius multifiliis]|eukprot:XP_004035265.1 hypothetical protein IMG5_102180 [Ichthyophthirius multifiliis]